MRAVAILEKGIDDLVGSDAGDDERRRAKILLYRSNPGLREAVELEMNGRTPVVKSKLLPADQAMATALLTNYKTAWAQFLAFRTQLPAEQRPVFDALARRVDAVVTEYSTFSKAIDGAEVLDAIRELAKTSGVARAIELLQQLAGEGELDPDQRHQLVHEALIALGADGAQGPEAKSVRSWRDAAVVALLGREPISKAELVRTRKRINDENPGLAQACRDEEAAERQAAVE